MKLEFIKPRFELKPYITKMWMFENDLGFGSQGTLIAPNARPKIIIPYKNTLTSKDNKITACNEGDIFFIGIRDCPVTLGTQKAGPTGSIGIELTTAGAYKFLNVSMHELTNSLFSFTDLFGTAGKELLQKMFSNEDPKQKVSAIQDFLIARLLKENRCNTIVDYSINLLLSSKGLVEIKELERKTGYSKRYLDMLFKQHLGISPKTYSTIVRFQSFYKNFSQADISCLNKNNIFDLYYDQSHFIKEFKRYTGITPTQFTSFKNDFGRHF